MCRPTTQLRNNSVALHSNLVLFTLTERNAKKEKKKKKKMKILIPSTITSELINYQKATRALEDNFSPPAQCLIVWR